MNTSIVLLVSIALTCSVFADNSTPKEETMLNRVSNIWDSVFSLYDSSNAPEIKADLVRDGVAHESELLEKLITDDSYGKSFELSRTFEGVDLVTDLVDVEEGVKMLNDLEDREITICNDLAAFTVSNQKSKLLTKYNFVNPDSAPHLFFLFGQYENALRIGCNNVLALKKSLKGQPTDLICGTMVDLPLMLNRHSIATDTKFSMQELNDQNSKNRYKRVQNRVGEFAKLKNSIDEMLIIRQEISGLVGDETVEILSIQLLDQLHRNKFLCKLNEDIKPLIPEVAVSDSEIQKDEAGEEISESDEDSSVSAQ